MKKNFILIFCLLISSIPFYSQTPNKDKTISTEFSESIPYTPTDFPVEKPKKEKKRKSESSKEKNADLTTENKSVTVPVTVVNQQNVVVTDLKKSDFRLFVDDQEIEDFTLENKEESLNIFLLLDTSPSTTYQEKDLQNFALAFAANLKPQDRIRLADFNEKFKVRTEMTNDRQIINKAINNLNFGDGTSLYDAIEQTFEQNIANLSGRSALVLITDGVDTTSIESNYQKSLETAEKYDVPVFIIYLDTFEQSNKVKTNNPNSIVLQNILKNAGSSKMENELGKYYLNDLVRLSGGRISLLKDISDSQKIVSPKFADELRLKYYLKFTPSENGKKGERKEIKVRVNRPNLSLFAKGSCIPN